MERKTDGTLRKLRRPPSNGWLRSPEVVNKFKAAMVERRKRLQE